MSDLINRQDAITSYQSVCRGVTCAACPFLIKDGVFTDCRLERFIHELPSVEPERKTGQWLNGFCSSCGKEAVTEWNENGGEYLLSDFCPFCGADTREAKRMSNLIDRQAAISLAKDLCVPTKDGTVYRHRCIDPDAIRELPSAQPEITHCAECIHWKHSAIRKSYCEVFDWVNTAEDFCSFAERKDDEE